ncbi:unnamed protein product [Nezara viridula]|uniref:Uncharacterized protein n=1 Tax=Nezara viridula TaxID=85310 RepID=A0A9P0GXY4_NEZVI|nr:unnamed protein product [Nezara viridula]
MSYRKVTSKKKNRTRNKLIALSFGLPRSLFLDHAQ